MHDWTLISLDFEWATGVATIKFLNSESNIELLIVKGGSMIHVPREQEWGRSVSVNKVIGPTQLESDKQRLQIEMQSGDIIEIIAISFELASKNNRKPLFPAT